MKTRLINRGTRRANTAGCVILAMLLAMAGLAVLLISGYLRPGAETRALRSAVATSLGQQPHKKVHLNVGWFTTALVRQGTRWVDMPEEARIAMGSVQGVEVGVYEMPELAGKEPRLVLPAADKKMHARGWERAVGVVDGRQVVAVYVPSKPVSPSRMKVCVLVLDGNQLVLGTARADLEKAIEFLDQKLEWLKR